MLKTSGGFRVSVWCWNYCAERKSYDIETPRVLRIQGGPRSPALGFRV